ncbi:hypothetical protein QUB68_12235 [Microcoleus sp. A006_D1]|uniref:hypothetical protein n=1 Tax=Microcoleus sp. A006_D1 TaxID=3055267 RepID=UPI002FD632A9
MAWPGQGQYVRLLAPQTRMVVRSDLPLAGSELLPIAQFGLGGPETVRGYRQDALLPIAGFLLQSCGIRGAPATKNCFAGDAVCGYWQFLAQRANAGSASEYFAVSGIGLAVAVRATGGMLAQAGELL